MFSRKLNLPKLLEKKSHFLFGPRSTGKSTLIHASLKNATVYDLLDTDVFAELLRRPKIIEENLRSNLVVIDEVQKLPTILDEVHRLIEKHKKVRFLLTGSSARKVRHGSANLLAGRAWVAELFPLVSSEIDDFNLTQYLNRGGLPHIYPSSDFNEELKAYVNNYLREEIQAEALVQNLSVFSSFFDIMGLSNGCELNYESIRSECGGSINTVKRFVDILQDTLIGFRLPAWTLSKKRKAIQRAKFYFFDCGVARQLARRGEIGEHSKEFGEAFEHFIILEIRAFLSYSHSPKRMFYWRSTSAKEVDLVIERDLALEIKATTLVQDKHLRGLKAINEEGLIKKLAIVSLDREARITQGNIQIYPWQEFLQKLWAGEII